VAKSIQPAVKQDLRQIWMAPDLKAAERAFDVFKKKLGTDGTSTLQRQMRSYRLCP
jgi:transposase-like protein